MSNESIRINVTGGTSVATPAPIPITHSPRSFGSLGSISSISRPIIATLRHSNSTVPENGRNQFKIGNTVVHTLGSSSSSSNIANSQISRTPTSISACRSQQHNRPSQWLCTNRDSGIRREIFVGRGSRVGGCNSGIVRRRHAYSSSLVWNDWNGFQLPNNITDALGCFSIASNANVLSRSSNTTTSAPETTLDETNEHLIECEKCKLWISHKYIDDHMVAHDFEIVLENGQSNNNVTPSSSTNTLPISSLSSNFLPGMLHEAYSTNEVTIGETSVANEEIETADNNNELVPLTNPLWQGLGRRRDALWPFIRVNTNRGISTQDSNISTNSNNDSVSTETAVTLERRGVQSSLGISNDEESVSFNEPIVVRRNRINNSILSARAVRNNSVDDSTTSNTYVYNIPYNRENYNRSSISFPTYGTNAYEDPSIRLSTYRNTYCTPSARYPESLNVSSICTTTTYPRSLNNSSLPRPTFSVSQRTTSFPRSFIYPVRPAAATVGEIAENTSPLPQVSISLLPTSIFDASRSSSLREIGRTCAICLEEYVTGDRQRRLPCTHAYHEDCIDAWLKKSRLCPFCKYNVNP